MTQDEINSNDLSGRGQWAKTMHVQTAPPLATCGLQTENMTHM
jgi:hypothetical protein